MKNKNLIWTGHSQKMTKTLITILLMAAVVLMGLGCNPSIPRPEIVLADLNNPRGLLLQEDGNLCVAEAGALPIGQEYPERPTTIVEDTGSVTCVDPGGKRSVIADSLPFVLYSGNNMIVRPADVAQIGGRIYVLTGEGYRESSRALLRLSPNREPPEKVADFLLFVADGKPVEYFTQGNFPVNPFAMVPSANGKNFLVTDGAAGEVWNSDLSGNIEKYAPVEGHAVISLHSNLNRQAPMAKYRTAIPTSTPDCTNTPLGPIPREMMF